MSRIQKRNLVNIASTPTITSPNVTTWRLPALQPGSCGVQQRPRRHRGGRGGRGRGGGQAKSILPRLPPAVLPRVRPPGLPTRSPHTGRGAEVARGRTALFPPHRRKGKGRRSGQRRRCGRHGGERGGGRGVTGSTTEVRKPGIYGHTSSA